jgi:hypothetical protein
MDAVTEPDSGSVVSGVPEPISRTSRSLRSRLTALFVVATLALVAIGAVSALSFVQLINARHTLLAEIDPASLDADKLLLAYVDQETGVRGYILSRDRSFLQPAVQGVINQQSAERALDRDLTNQPTLLLLVKKAERQAGMWQAVFARPAIAATAAGSSLYSSERALLNSKSLFDSIRSHFGTLDDALTQARTNAGHSLSVATDELAAALIGGVVLLLAGGLALRVALRRLVTTPLLSLGDDARLVARGELSHSIEPEGPTEIQSLAADVEAMRQRILSELQEVAAARAELDERNEDLHRSNRELEQFAYVASHDLQEPLRKVSSFVQLLEERYRGELDDKADIYIAHAVDGARRMQSLIHDLLEFSRVGRTSTRVADMSMTAAVETAIDNLEAAIRDVGASIDVAPLPTVKGDGVLLASLWQNLIGNSLKFHGEDRLSVSIDFRRLGDAYEFSISDNGIGIEQRFAEKVFVIFQRLHGREAYEGTGIGLALCQKIVEFHGGRIWLDVTNHTGTRICFTLPVPEETISEPND